MPGVDLMVSLSEPVTLPRVDHELGRNATGDEGLIELPCLPERGAQVIRTVEKQRRCCRRGDVCYGGAIDVHGLRLTSVRLPVEHQLIEGRVVAGVVAADEIGNP